MNIDKEKLTAEVVKYQNGDGNAFEAIYNLTNKAAYFTAMKIVKNEDDAQDVLQDSYVKALEKLATLDKPESFMSWFNMIVANNAKNYLAKNKSGRFVDTKVVIDEDEGEEVSIVELIEDKDECFIPEASTENTELCNDVMSLIEGLSDDKRTAVVLYYYNEMTTKQIAESLGVNENTIKSRLVQAKKDLAAGIHALEKKNKSILGIAPMSVVRWALNYNGSDAYQKDMPDLAPLLEKIQGLESHGFSALEKIRFRFADFFSHFGSGSGAGHDKGAVFKSAAAVVATAGVVGGAVAGTNAIKNRDKTPPAETTTAYVEEAEPREVQITKPEPIKADDDRVYLLVDKEDKKVDADIETREFDFGVNGFITQYDVKTDDGRETIEKIVLNRGAYNYDTSYSDLQPYARSNMAQYSGEINKTFSGINAVRGSSDRVALSEKLTEQANARALEIAYSGIDIKLRPDGSSYKTFFDQNGYTEGARNEIIVTGCETPEQALETITGGTNASVISDPLVKEVGIGVAQDPESGKYVYVVDLYSPDGVDVNDTSRSDEIRLNLVKGIRQIENGVYYQSVDNYNFINETPVLREWGKIDNPMDELLLAVSNAIDKLRDN